MLKKLGRQAQKVNRKKRIQIEKKEFKSGKKNSNQEKRIQIGKKRIQITHREKENKFLARIRIKLFLVTFQNKSNMTCFIFHTKPVLLCTNVMLFIYICLLYTSPSPRDS